MGGKMSKGGESRSSESKAVDESRPSGTPAPSRQEDIKQHVKTQRNLERLPPDVLKKIGLYLSEEEMKRAELELSKPTGRIRFFQDTLDELNVLKDVVTGNVESLIAAVRHKPELLFILSDSITDPAGQRFFNVCPYQMMLFLCDDDMLNQVMRVVSPLPEQLGKQMKLIRAGLHQGGADLIKLDRDPQVLNFDDILRFRTTYTLSANIITRDAIFPLLENPDGVLYYKDEHNQEHWAYANQATMTIKLIELAPRLTDNQQEAYERLVTSMDAMEPMSARRSSNDEHQFMASHMRYLDSVKSKTMAPVTLVRQGITYIQDGIQYRDTHHDFNRYTNAYRKCTRLYLQSLWEDGSRAWRRELGHAQKEVMWLLQRYCEENRPFDPLSGHYKSEPFRRGFKFENRAGGPIDDIYSANTGMFFLGFGSDFGLYKGRRGRRGSRRRCAI